MSQEIQSEDPVLERIDELRERSKAAERTYEYVHSEHDAECSPSDMLHTLRQDESLALEYRDNDGRTVVCALTDNTGKSRYPVWEHSKYDSETRSRTIEPLRDVKARLEARSPRIRLREETPLAGLEAPNDWDRLKGDREGYNGP